MIRYTRTEICIFLIVTFLIVGLLSAVAYEQYYKFNFQLLVFCLEAWSQSPN